MRHCERRLRGGGVYDSRMPPIPTRNESKGRLNEMGVFGVQVFSVTSSLVVAITCHD